MTVTRMIPVHQIDRSPVPTPLAPMGFTDLIEAVSDLGNRVTVRRIPATGRYLLVLGEAQYAAARAARHAVIEATVLNVSDDGRAGRLLMAVARKIGSPDISPMEEATLFERLADAGFSHCEIADACGKLPTYIRWRIELLDLCPAGQTALSKGRLPVGLAWYVSRLDSTSQVPFLNRWLRGEFDGARAAEDAARDLRLAS